MAKKDRRWNGPKVPPIQKIELSSQNILPRAIGVGILLLIAAVSLGYAIHSLVSVEPGWQEIESSASGVHCGGDFRFEYDFSDYGGNASASFKALEKLYTQLTEDAYRIFSAEEGEGNLAAVNRAPGEIVTVEPALYDAFSLLEEAESRLLYLAPVYVEYNRIFLCETEGEAAMYDPAQNEELQPYIREAAAFANDPEMISVELLGNDQVRLNVAAEYAAFAEEYGIEAYLDFGWLTNAFIIDYMAEKLAENDYIYGHISSYDGFTRNLDNRGKSYDYNVFDRQGDTINLPAVLRYSEPRSIVFLRDYPMSDRDRWHYFGFSNGSAASVYIDPADGMNRNAIDSLVSYSRDSGCAEIAVRMAPVFLGDAFAPADLSQMELDGIYSLWCVEDILHCNDEAAQLEIQTDESGKSYTLHKGSTVTN